MKIMRFPSSIVFLAFVSMFSCDSTLDPVYRERMREFVQTISNYAKTENPAFIIIPQNGHELVTLTGEADDPIQYTYIEAIDGAGQEDLFYGYRADDRKTNEEDTEYLSVYLDIYEENGVEVLVTDYCITPEKVDDSYEKNAARSYISFAAPDRELNTIPSYPELANESEADIRSLSEVKNFLYLINPEKYQTSEALADAIAASNYDLVILDLFYEDQLFNANQIEKMHWKANGGRRLLIAYMSIGEAEDYRYYWKEDWNSQPPEWLDEENSRWKGNYKVAYWDPDWQAIILGSQDAYLDMIINSGFDGVYLDIIEAFEHFE